MQFTLASDKDDEALKSFFSEQVLEGVYDYRLVRPHSFFDQYRLTTDDHQTYMLKDSDGTIQAMASTLFKKAYINDQEQTIGYVTDLRVAHSRSATLGWAKEFIPRMEAEREQRQCQFVFSDLEQFENIAYNTLLRRRNRSTRMPRYHLFRKFFVVAVYGKNLFADEPIETIKIERGKTEDAEAIARYLQGKSVRRPLRYKFDAEDLERRCREWPNFSIQNFHIARNFQGNIVGCLAPWNNRDVQRVVAHRYHNKSFQVYSTSRTLAPLGITRPFPKQGEEFKVKHITHLACDNPDIFYALLNRAYLECKNQEILIYPNYIGDYARRPPQAFVHIKIPYGLYSVLDNEDKLPTYLHPNPFYPAPDFQLSYF